MAGEWVLVTDGGGGRSRDAVAAVRGLAAAGYRPALAVARGSSRGPLSRAVVRTHPTPRAGEGGYAEAIRSLVEANGYLTVVSAGEPASEALGLIPARLDGKLALEVAGQAAGFEVPKSRSFEGPGALRAAAGDLPYPVVIKPVRKTFNAFRATRLEDLVRDLPDGPLLAQEALGGVRSAVVGVNAGGDLVAAVHERWLRTFPPGCGLAAAAVTVRPDLSVERRLSILLADHEGPFVAQFVGGALIDLNLRVASTHALGEAAGVNVVGTWCEVVAGGSPAPRRARPGVRWRWFEGDLRTTIAGVRTGEITATDAARRLVPRRGTAHSIESIRDPGPMIARAVGAFDRMRERKGAS